MRKLFGFVFVAVMTLILFGLQTPLRTVLSAQQTPTQLATSSASHPTRTVFLIVMENHNWSQIKGNRSAPYINNVLLPMAFHAEQYYNPKGNHPSELNYLWLEAGTNFTINNDDEPRENHQPTKLHLVSLLDQAGITWKAYQEGIPGTECPLENVGHYAPKHNPMVFFDDVTDSGQPNSVKCIVHERLYSELATDLQRNTVAAYNFITPDLCHDMHNMFGCASVDAVRNGDTWLSRYETLD